MRVELLAPDTRLWYRPLAVAEPFGLGDVRHFDLPDLAAAMGAAFTLGKLASVDTARRLAYTEPGGAVSYSSLLIATGALPTPAVHGALTFRGPADVETAWRRLGGVPLVLEGYIAFDREVSQIGVRSRDGAVALYPLVENHHKDGILRLTLAPAPDLTPALQEQAARAIRGVLDELDYVGVLAIEFFQKGEALIANEMAPRVHNSGHWTIEGAVTSQFENHVRAICGLPLGDTRTVAERVEMLNLIGTSGAEAAATLADPAVHLHLYGKAEARAGRKMGHVTRMG